MSARNGRTALSTEGASAKLISSVFRAKDVLLHLPIYTHRALYGSICVARNEEFAQGTQLFFYTPFEKTEKLWSSGSKLDARAKVVTLDMLYWTIVQQLKKLSWRLAINRVENHEEAGRGKQSNSRSPGLQRYECIFLQ